MDVRWSVCQHGSESDGVLPDGARQSGLCIAMAFGKERDETETGRGVGVITSVGGRGDGGRVGLVR